MTNCCSREQWDKHFMANDANVVINPTWLLWQHSPTTPLTRLERVPMPNDIDIWENTPPIPFEYGEQLCPAKPFFLYFYVRYRLFPQSRRYILCEVNQFHWLDSFVPLWWYQRREEVVVLQQMIVKVLKSSQMWTHFVALLFIAIGNIVDIVVFIHSVCGTLSSISVCTHMLMRQINVTNGPYRA